MVERARWRRPSQEVLGDEIGCLMDRACGEMMFARWRGLGLGARGSGLCVKPALIKCRHLHRTSSQRPSFIAAPSARSAVLDAGVLVPLFSGPWTLASYTFPQEWDRSRAENGASTGQRTPWDGLGGGHGAPFTQTFQLGVWRGPGASSPRTGHC